MSRLGDSPRPSSRFSGVLQYARYANRQMFEAFARPPGIGGRQGGHSARSDRERAHPARNPLPPCPHPPQHSALPRSELINGPRRRALP